MQQRSYHRHFLHSAVLVALCCLVLATTAFAQAGRVSGSVKGDDGQPIKGATVTAINPKASPNTHTTTTDDKGRWSMIGLAKGAWTFTATAQGHAPIQGKADIVTLAPNPPIDFTLQKGAGSGALALAGVNTKELQAELEAADGMMQAAQYNQAIAAYQAMLVKAPALSVINLQIGEAYRQKKEYDKAIAAYQELLKADPANQKAKAAIGMANLEKGDLAAAEQTLTAATEGGATVDREIYYDLGEVKFAQGQPDEAAKWYEKATQADPTWGKPLFKLGLVALNKGDKEGAVGYFEKLQAVDAFSPEAAQAKAVIAELKK